MVPGGGGGRMNRGPRDHLEAIIYMSRATPRKRRDGWLAWLTAGRARISPVVPWASKSLSDGVPPRLEFREAGLRLPRRAPASRAGPCGRVVPAKRRRGLGAARQAWGRCHCQDVARPPTSGSLGFGSPAPSTQPAVVFAPRDPGPSYLAPLARAVAGFWLGRWFQTSEVFE
jgi:hypothetical protein